jgi:hypothetical protein
MPFSLRKKFMTPAEIFEAELNEEIIEEQEPLEMIECIPHVAT